MLARQYKWKVYLLAVFPFELGPAKLLKRADDVLVEHPGCLALHFELALNFLSSLLAAEGPLFHGLQIVQAKALVVDLLLLRFVVHYVVIHESLDVADFALELIYVIEFFLY